MLKISEFTDMHREEKTELMDNPFITLNSDVSWFATKVRIMTKVNLIRNIHHFGILPM